MRTNEDLTLLETRMLEYKNAALNAKKDNQVENAIKHFKVLKVNICYMWWVQNVLVMSQESLLLTCQ